MNSLTASLPFIAFGLLMVLLYQGFRMGDPQTLPSALSGQPWPQFSLPELLTGQTVTQDDFKGRAALVNVWATWCPTCLAEHHELKRIAENFRVPVLGINYKDDPVAARAWLARFGNPYLLTVIDRDGRLGIDLGVYGAPETFVIDAQGLIHHRRVGAVDMRVWEQELKPVLVNFMPELLQPLASGDEEKADVHE